MFLKVFLTELFEQIVKSPSTECPMRNLVNIGQEKTFKNLHDFIHVYSPRALADNPNGTIF